MVHNLRTGQKHTSQWNCICWGFLVKVTEHNLNHMLSVVLHHLIIGFIQCCRASGLCLLLLLVVRQTYIVPSLCHHICKHHCIRNRTRSSGLPLCCSLTHSQWPEFASTTPAVEKQNKTKRRCCLNICMCAKCGVLSFLLRRSQQNWLRLQKALYDNSPANRKGFNISTVC